MSTLLSPAPESELLTWPLPDRVSIQAKHRNAFDQRVSALRAVISGASILSAADLYEVDRETLTWMVEQAPSLADDGKPKGFRVCIPYFRHGIAAVPKGAGIPTKATPHAFTQLLSTVGEAAALVNSYAGPLPVQNQRCSEFETLFRRFKALLKERGLAKSYPLNSADKGRRALLKWLKRKRAHWQADQLAVAEEDESLPAFARHMANRPMDRVEFDGHSTDVKWHALVPTAAGEWVKKVISRLWLLIIIDSASRAIVAWNLVIGPNYNRFDVLRTYAKALSPWSPTTPLHPDLEYAHGAWMPTMVATPADVPRPALIAMDNHMAHISHMATQNLGTHQQGVVNLGPAGTPESRPHVEGVFKRAEDLFFRFIAGGFKPSRTLGVPSMATTKMDPSDHPIDLQLLENALDIWVSAYNITPQEALDDRSPKDIFDGYLDNGGWLNTSSETEKDKADLLTIHLKPTLRASSSDGGLPVVNWANGRYRSTKLRDQDGLIGKRFSATVAADDIRNMSLWDANGNLLVILRVQPPYAASAHTLETRRRVERGKAKGLYTIPAGSDAIAIYNTFVRSKAAELQSATDEFVRLGMLDTPRNPKSVHAGNRAVRPTKDTFSGLVPLAGSVTLTSPKPNKPV